MNPIELRNLHKNYGAIRAVKDVSFDVKPGEIFGLIGPDGAGKTTIMRILVSLLHADQGTVHFQGRDVTVDAVYVRSHVGYMPQRFSLYRDLTVEENLRFFGDLFRISRKEQAGRIRDLYAFSRLEPFKHRRAEDLSGGMKQKLALSCMLMHQPEVVVLDEPTFGVDPVSRQEFWDILKKLADNGTSILVSTAYMDEAGLCDRVGLMFEGQLLATDRPEKLLDRYDRPLYLIETDQPHALYTKLQILDFEVTLNLFGNGVHLTDESELGINTLRERLHAGNIPFKQLKRIKPELEDLFLRLMQPAGQRDDQPTREDKDRFTS